jgi:ABC-type multidrug transport system fused ATPase/permease subunit
MMSAGENSSLDASDLYRIGLARVMLSNASVVLLNKPFKAAGRDFEEVLLQSLTRLRQSRTIIIITDNPNCLARCDQLIVMSSGKVAFQGKPADLLSATSTANP